MQTILIVSHLLLALGLIGLVLIQHGKGADAGAAFGSGASATVFGARGSSNFLSRATAMLAGLFFLTSLALAYFAMQGVEQPGLMEAAPVAAPAAVGAVPEAAGEAPVPATDVPTVPETPLPAGVDSSGVPVAPAGAGTD